MILFLRPVTPEDHTDRLLLAAVIRRAAYDIALYKSNKSLKARRIWQDAYRWMFDNDVTEDWTDQFMSFVNVCHMLNQDPNEIRRKTLKLTKRDVRKYDMIDPYGRIH